MENFFSFIFLLHLPAVLIFYLSSVIVFSSFLSSFLNVHLSAFFYSVFSTTCNRKVVIEKLDPSAAGLVEWSKDCSLNPQLEVDPGSSLTRVAFSSDRDVC